MTNTLNPQMTYTSQLGLDSEREAFLNRARRNAQMTIPHLAPEQGHTSFSQLPQPWESTGAYLLNNLANKVTQSIFPVGVPLARLGLQAKVKRELDALPDGRRERLKQQVEARLSSIERNDIAPKIDADGDIEVMSKCVTQLLLSGNYSVQVKSDGMLKGRNLSNYYTQRAYDGSILKAELVDFMPYSMLDVASQEAAALSLNQPPMLIPGDKTFAVVTMITRTTPTSFKVHTEISGRKVAETEETYSEDKLPYLFPVYSHVEGENFGRSYVENYIADLESLDSMSETVQRGTQALARLIYLFRPGATINKNAWKNAVTGDAITGTSSDVSTPDIRKQADFQGSLAVQDRILIRLGKAFLEGTSQIRNAERVTAVEIQFLAREIETQLGSAYIGLVRSLQRPHMLLKIDFMRRKKLIPAFDLDQVTVSIMTGAASLTRQAKASALLQGLSQVAQLDAEGLKERLDTSTLINLLAEASGHSFDGVLKTEEEVTEERRTRMAEQTLATQLQQPPQQQQQQQPNPQPQTQP